MKPEKLQQLKEQHPDLVFESVDGNVIVKEKPVGRWRADEGKPYFYVTQYGAIMTYDEIGDHFDNFLHQTGNYFKTEKEAEAYKQHLIDRQKVLDRMAELKNEGYYTGLRFVNQAVYTQLRSEFTHEQLFTLLS